MAVRPRKVWRDAEQKRALRLLAGSPHGATEAIMLALASSVDPSIQTDCTRKSWGGATIHAAPENRVPPAAGPAIIGVTARKCPECTGSRTKREHKGAVPLELQATWDAFEPRELLGFQAPCRARKVQRDPDPRAHLSTPTLSPPRAAANRQKQA
jgi:hypothetical protein